MLFAELVETSARVAATRSKLDKVGTLSGFLQRLAADEIATAVSYLSGVLPQRRLGVGYATVHRAKAVPAAAQPSLAVLEVNAALERLSQLSGPGSVNERQRLLGKLFEQATDAEQSFLARLLVNELRQGALEGIMAEAIAHAAGVSPSSVRRALMFAGEASAVAMAALTEREAGLARFRLQLFRPVQPMLAQTAETVEEALASLGEAVWEYKLDGARIQVHREGDDVSVFSRDGNEVTGAVPEVVELVKALPARSIVLDGEALVLRPNGAPQPFQTTMRRFGRKLDVKVASGEFPITPFFFDLLHLDGQDIVEKPWTERSSALAQSVPAKAQVPRRIVSGAEEAEAFYAQALRDGHEGLLAKKLSSPYEAGRRGAAWLKLKPAHTLDLVVLAAEWGNGKRQGFLSNIHLGARDPSNGAFVMLGKTFKGMTDAMLAWQTQWFLAHEVTRDAYTVYVKPELVAEIAFDSLLASPHYPGGMALRFARVKRYREDKRAEEADTIETVRNIFLRTHGPDQSR